MDKVELKDLHIYKLKTIKEFHVESEIYIDNDNLYKIIVPYFITGREKIVERLNKYNIEGTIVPQKKIIMTNHKQEIFKGYVMHYYKEYINLKKLLDSNSLTIDQRITIVKKINEIYRRILEYGYVFTDCKLSNIIVNNTSTLFSDMDSIKPINSKIMQKEKEKIFLTSLSLLLNVNIKKKDLNEENINYIKSVITSNYLLQIIDNYFNGKENTKFKEDIYLDNCLDSIKLNLIK